MRARTRALRGNQDMPGEERFKEPRIFDLPSYTMAVVESTGDPSIPGEDVLQALYGAVYGLKFRLRKDGGDDFKVHALRARWHDENPGTVLWALPIPDGTAELPKTVEKPEVRIEVWEYGAVAQILHIGPFSEEGPVVEYLRGFIEASGFEIAGMREEEYVTRPNSAERKVYIRYQVRRRR